MILRFGFVSGIGWLIDFSLFAYLCWIGVPVWVANIVGASVAVLFVFFVSVRHIFQYKEHYLIRKLMAYVVYQVIAILTASLLVNAGTQWFDLVPVASKIIVTPLTFYANFQFMSLITSGKLRCF